MVVPEPLTRAALEQAIVRIAQSALGRQADDPLVLPYFTRPERRGRQEN